jgi:hypothetical protein
MSTTEHKLDKGETTHKAGKVFPRVGLFSCVSIIQPMLTAMYSLFPLMLYKSAFQTVVGEVCLVVCEEIPKLFC